MHRLSSSAALLLFAAVTASPLLAGSAAAETPPPAPDVPFIYERISSAHRYEADGTGRVVSELRIRIQNEIAAQQIGQLFFPYVAGRNRLELEVLRVRKRDGSVTDASPDLLQDLPAPVTALFPVYSDARIVHATVPAFRPGDVVEIKLVDHLETPDAARFWMVYTFERGTVVHEEVLEVDVPADEPIHLRTAEGPEAEVTEGQGRRRHRWTHSNATPTAISLEDFAGSAPRPDVELSSFRSWQEVGAWYRTLEGKRATPDAAIRDKARELTAGLDDDAAKLEAIYGYVTRELRYLGLLFGASRYQPHPAAEVFANGYGDCKDKHTLLAALLSAAGFGSAPVLIGSLGEVAEDVPSPEAFDHMITAVPRGEDLLFLDSTLIAPFGYLAPELRDKKALLVPLDDEPRLVETPEGLPFPSRRSFTLDGEVDDAGRLDAQVELRFRGDDEHLMRIAFMSTPAVNWRDVMQVMSQALGMLGEVEDVEVADLTAAEEPLRIAYRLSRAGYVKAYSREQKLDLLLPPDELAMLPEPAPEEAPKPLRLGLPVVSSHRFSVTLPERFAASLPVAVTLERDFGSYRSDYRIDGRSIHLEEEIAVKQTEVPPERFKEYEAFRNSVVQARKQTFLLRSSGVTETAAAAADAGMLFEAAGQAADDGDQATAIELYSRVVELEPEHETAWLELGVTLTRSGDADQGAEAIRRHLEIDPYHERGYKKLGWALEEAGDLPGARAAYRSHLEQYPLDHYANQRLGGLLATGDACGEAVTFLRHAISIKPNDHDSRTRLGVCYLELGQNAEGLATLTPLLEQATEGWMLSYAGHAALERDELDAALSFYTRATELDDDEHSLVKLAEIHHRRGDAARAVELLERAAPVEPDDPQAFLTRGILLMQSGDLAAAEAALRRVLELAPEDARPLAPLGWILAEQGKADEAIATYRQAIAADPGDARALEGLSQTLATSGKVDEAIVALGRLLEVRPDFAEAQGMLASMLFYEERYEEAAEASRKALALNPAELYANHTLGMIFARQERYAEALPHLEKARAGAPGAFPDQDVLDYVREQVGAGEAP